MTCFKFINGTIPGELNSMISVRGNSTAVISKDGSMTYGELWKTASSIARGLRSLGLKRGDHVALWMANNRWFVPSFLGIVSMGCIFVPLNTRYRAREAAYILANSSSKALITADLFLASDYMEMLGEFVGENNELQHVIVAGRLSSLPGTEVLSMDQLLERDVGVDENEFSKMACGISPNDNAMILYTSGTTGEPKGAMLSHRNVCVNARTTGEVMKVVPEDVFFLPLPLFHVFGLVLGCVTPLLFGASIVLEEVFSPKEALELMEEHRCTMNYGVPAMFIMELEEFGRKKCDLSQLRSGIMGGAPCPIEVVRATLEEMKCNICIGYGITETSPLITLSRFDDTPERRANTVGKPIPGVEVKIVDEKRNEVGVDEIGEIAIRGNNMKGYYGMPERTAEVLDENRWYYSGDLGKKDGDGYVSVTGRKKDLIITGGFNVYPREVEEFLFTHPSVQNAAVVGAEDIRLGETVCAFIMLKDGCMATEEEMIGYCKGNMANFKVPRRVEFVDGFPMTQSGKIQKFRLREMAGRGARG